MLYDICYITSKLKTFLYSRWKDKNNLLYAILYKLQSSTENDYILTVYDLKTPIQHVR